MKHLVSHQGQINRRSEFWKADVSSVSPSSEQSGRLTTAVNLPSILAPLSVCSSIQLATFFLLIFTGSRLTTSSPSTNANK